MARRRCYGNVLPRAAFARLPELLESITVDVLDARVNRRYIDRLRVDLGRDHARAVVSDRHTGYSP